jgi:antitoxin YefM
VVAAAEWASLQESAHLLRSPANAKRLMTALTRAAARSVEPQSLDQLRREVGLEEAP